MKLYGVYQVKDANATAPDMYRLVGIFYNKSRATEKSGELVREHDYYHAEVYPIYIPDELVVLFLDAAEQSIEL